MIAGGPPYNPYQDTQRPGPPEFDHQQPHPAPSPASQFNNQNSHFNQSPHSPNPNPTGNNPSKQGPQPPFISQSPYSQHHQPLLPSSADPYQLYPQSQPTQNYNNNNNTLKKQPTSQQHHFDKSNSSLSPSSSPPSSPQKTSLHQDGMRRETGSLERPWGRCDPLVVRWLFHPLHGL